MKPFSRAKSAGQSRKDGGRFPHGAGAGAVLRARVPFHVLLVVFALTLPSAARAQSSDPRKQIFDSKLVSESTEGEAERISLLLSPGDDKVVDLKFDAHPDASKGLIVGNDKVVKAQPVIISGKTNQVVFKPLQTGETSVSLRNETGKLMVVFDVTVTSANLLKMATELSELLKDIEGLNIRVKRDVIVVDGELIVPTDYGRLLNVIRGENSPYQKIVMNLATLSPLALQIVAKRIQDDVNTFAKGVKVRVVNQQVWLEGTVDSIDKARRATKVAELYLPEITPGEALKKYDPAHKFVEGRRPIQNFLIVQAPPPKKQDKLVRVTVHLVELKKDYTKVFGFKWQPGFNGNPEIAFQGGGDAQGATTTQFTAVISNLFPKLNSAQNAGFARVLKSGTVLARSGTPARLEDQRNFAATTVNAQGTAQGATDQFGMLVAVTPKILGQSEDIQMDLDISQSTLLGQTIGGSALTAKHAVKTMLYIKSGESAAVAGVDSTDVRTLFNKDDPIGDGSDGNIQPLFSILRSKNYVKEKSQFVIFVTPQIIDNASEGTQDLKRNFRVKVD